MHYLQYNEQIQHRTGALPLAYYYVDEHHPRYHMRMHWHREMELIRIRKGVLHLYVDDQLLTCREGDLVVLGESVLHGGDAENGAYECIVFDPYALLMPIEACKSAMKSMPSQTLFLPADTMDDAVRAAVQALYAAMSGDVSGNALRIVGALYGLFAELVGKEHRRVLSESARQGVKAEQLKPALEYIEKNYGGHVTLEELARLTGLSPKYFCRWFRTITHRSPIDYLNYYRIECAGDYLTSTDMTVAEIAQRCGYNDSSFFIKQFKRYKGVTPRQYRIGG